MFFFFTLPSFLIVNARCEGGRVEGGKVEGLEREMNGGAGGMEGRNEGGTKEMMDG